MGIFAINCHHQARKPFYNTSCRPHTDQKPAPSKQIYSQNFLHQSMCNRETNKRLVNLIKFCQSIKRSRVRFRVNEIINMLSPKQLSLIVSRKIARFNLVFGHTLVQNASTHACQCLRASSTIFRQHPLGGYPVGKTQ